MIITNVNSKDLKSLENVHPRFAAAFEFIKKAVKEDLADGNYEIDEKNLTLRFGIIKSQTPINTITAIEMDKDDNKLSIFVGENYSVVLVNKEWN